MSPEESAALDAARALAAAGIPVFVATPDPSKPTGFALPGGWQRTAPDPRAVDLWRPGMALCAVMGHGLDLLDVDPRSGGDVSALNGSVPVSYAAAVTPSGGVHSFIRSLGVRSRDGVLPGVDVKAGDAAGEGRGFAFIAPTVRVSKVDGQPTPYRWINPPDLARLAVAASDMSGQALAQLVQRPRAGAEPGVDEFMRSGPWSDIPRALAGGRNHGVARLAASLRGRGGWRLEDALDYMYVKVWPLIDQTQGGHDFPADEFEATIRAAWRQYPDGGEQRAMAAATPPAPGGPAPNAARYFSDKGALLAATLAGDVVGLGPLSKGVDGWMWRYAGGVWRAEKDVITDRLTWLLGERYRSTHGTTVRDIVRARVNEIDCSPVSRLINFRNGLLDWRTGELQPHRPEVPSTVQLGVAYEPDAVCPAFDRFIGQVVPADMVPVVWELIGYLMYSGNPLHKAVMLTGKGRNGKGTFLRVVTALLDVRNITSVSLVDLVGTRFSTASLFGKLANIAGDIDGTYLENTATFKAITGGDTISAERKGRDRFDFTPWAVPMFSANKIPASADTSAGYLSRWLVIPFPYDFRGREDRTLDARLGTPAELAGIARKAVGVLGELLARGDFATTESGREAADEFTRRVDQVRTWLHDCTDLAETHPFANRTDLYRAYQAWAARDGHRPVKATEFYDRLDEAGLPAVKIHGARGYYGIKIVDSGFTVPTVSSVMSVVTNPDNSTPAQNEPAPMINTPTTVVPQANPQTGDDLGGNGGLPLPTRNISESQNIRGKGPRPLAAPAAPKSSKREAAAIARAAAKAEAVAAAGGELIELPATVDRAGVVTPISLADAGATLAGIIMRAGSLTVDVETSGYPVGHAEHVLRTVQLGDQALAVVLDATDPAHAEIASIALAAAPRLHAHSATADLGPLVAAGIADIDAWQRMYDTVIPAKLADPTSTGSDPGLKQLAGVMLREAATAPAADRDRAGLFKLAGWLTDTELTTPVDRSGWAQVDSRCTTMVRYAASDVLDTAALVGCLAPVPDTILARERAVQRITARVNHDGLRLDGDHVRAKLVEHGAAIELAAQRVNALGVSNPGSDKEVGAALTALGVRLPQTPTGRPSVAASALEALRGTPGNAGALVAAVLDYRHHETVVSTFLEPYRRLVEHGDGRARPTVYTLGTDTGRMSCVRPNLQQLPREGGVRACITADPGYTLISADFAGVELRVAAALSGDANLAAMIARGDDLHWMIAREVFGPEATKADRYVAKRVVFGRLYGGGATTLARQAGVNESIAQSAIDVLDSITPGLSAWSRTIRDAVKRGGNQFPTYAGRVIWLPTEYPHKGPNYAIQGSARELLVDALIRWDDTEWRGGVVLPVHDEIVAMVPEADAERATAALVAAMSSNLGGVEIRAEASKPSVSWQDSV